MEKNKGTIEKPLEATTANDRLFEALQNRVLGDSVVSSKGSAITNKINKAIEGVKAGQQASAQRITSEFNREINFAQGEALSDVATFQEGERGFATSMAALRRVVDTTDKNLKDLRMRKEEALLSNDAQALSTIAGLELKELEFKQQMEQQTFTNLLGAANFGISRSQEQRAAKAQSFAEKSAISNIALQYGIEVKEGDTMETITARAMPFASEKQRTELLKTKAEINRINAETSKVLQGESDSMDDAVIASIATAAITNPNILQLVKDPKQAALIALKIEELSKPREYKRDELVAEAESTKSKGTSYATALANLAANNTIKNKEEAKAILKEVYGSSTQKKNLGDISSDAIGAFINTTGRAAQFFGAPAPRNIYQDGKLVPNPER